jgi:hypothetical protein
MIINKTYYLSAGLRATFIVLPLVVFVLVAFNASAQGLAQAEPKSVGLSPTRLNRIDTVLRKFTLLVYQSIAH